MLKKFIESPKDLKEVTKDILSELIPDNIDLSTKVPSYVYEDIISYYKTKDDPCSEESLRCKFIYFATSMIHIFKDSAVCYIAPENRLPYVCINISQEGKMVVFRHEKILNADKFRICLQIVKSIKDIQMVKQCINLYTLDCMPYNTGNAVHICLRVDLDCVTFVKPNLAFEFITILYYKNQFSGVYHKTSTKLICAIH
jgi:hypothetical protein